MPQSAAVVAEEEPAPAHDALPGIVAEVRKDDRLQKALAIDTPKCLRLTPETELFLHRSPLLLCWIQLLVLVSIV
jgi:hypothetical protein